MHAFICSIFDLDLHRSVCVRRPNKSAIHIKCRVRDRARCDDGSSAPLRRLFLLHLKQQNINQPRQYYHFVCDRLLPAVASAPHKATLSFF